MKKLIVILSLIAFAAFAQAQTNQTAHSFWRGASNAWIFTGTAADTSALSDYVINVDARLAQKPLLYHVTVSIKETTADITGHTVNWQGSVDKVNWTTLNTGTANSDALQVFSFTNAGLSSVVQYAGTVDTVGVVSRPTLYPFYRLLMDTDVVGKAELEIFAGKLTEVD